MSTLSLRLPESLHERTREIAKKEGVSINQLVPSALAEKRWVRARSAACALEGDHAHDLLAF